MGSTAISDLSTYVNAQIAIVRPVAEGTISPTLTGAELTAAQTAKTTAQTNLKALVKIQSELAEYGVQRTYANTSLLNAYTTLTDTVADLTTYKQEADIIANKLDTDIVTTKKMIDINTYYSRQYEAYKELFILITIVATCVVFALLLGYTPLEPASRPITIGICILGGALIIYKIIYMMLVTDSNYDEYNWLVSPATDNGLYSTGVLDISGSSIGSICIGPSCCGLGTEWNSRRGCVLKPKDY